MDLFRFQHHIFDLDDTLVITKQTYWGAQKKALSELFTSDSPAQLHEKVQLLAWATKKFSSSFPELYFTAFLKELGAAPELVEQFLPLYEKHYWQDIQPLPNIQAWLEQLQAQGKSLAIVSNGEREKQLRKLEKTGLIKYFKEELVFVSDDFPKEWKKPAPHILTHCLAQLGGKPEEAIYYGNLLADVLAGKMAHTATCLIGPVEEEPFALAKPDLQILDWKELNHAIH